MKRYKVIVHVVREYAVKVDANDEWDAMNKAEDIEDLDKNGELIDEYNQIAIDIEEVLPEEE